jgi:hypothetical protein
MFVALNLCSAISAQRISDIVLNQDKRMLADVVNSDSLFVPDTAGKTKPELVDTGLSDNGNQRFLQWINSGRSLIYDKEGKLFLFDFEKHSSRIIPNEKLSTLSFFRWYQIQQTGLLLAPKR